MLVCLTYSFANVQDSSYCVGLTVFQCAIWRHREWDLRMRLSVILLFLVKWFELAKTYMYCFKNFLYSQRTTTFENSQLHPSRHQAREYHEMPETWWKVNLLCASESDIVSRLLIIFVEFIWAHLRGTDMRTHNTEFFSVLLYTIGAPGFLNITHDIQPMWALVWDINCILYGGKTDSLKCGTLIVLFPAFDCLLALIGTYYCCQSTII